MKREIFKGFELELINLGELICSWRDNERYRYIDDNDSFKTKADKEAHLLLIEIITKYFPNLPILSEEDIVFEKNRPNEYWLIDPIDGTSSWYNGFDGFVTQACLIKNSIPIYGAVYAPVLKKLWTGLRNKGAWINNRLLPKLKDIDRLILIDNYPKPRHIAAEITEKAKITKYIECGSLGLKACLVADGTADLFVKDVVIRDWDIAPAEVILNEVDGLITDLGGMAFSYTGYFEKTNGLVVARNSKLLNLVRPITV